MDPFCNICAKDRRDCDLFLTSCQHVLCQMCLQGQMICRLCNTPCRVMKICNDMPDKVKKFFKDVRPNFEECQKIVRFQEAHRQIGYQLHKRIWKEYFTAKNQLMEHKREYDMLCKEYAKMKQEMESGSNQSSFHTHRTPTNSTLSQSSGSQFTDNAKSIQNHSSLWDSPSSQINSSIDLGFSNLTVNQQRQPRGSSGGSLGPKKRYNK